MTRIVIDTNLLVSAILTPGGNPAKILKLVLEGKLNLIISQAILEEARQVFNYPKLVKLFLMIILLYPFLSQLIYNKVKACIFDSFYICQHFVYAQLKLYSFRARFHRRC